MKQVPIKLGPLALLLTVISICLTVLAILTFTTARADMRLAQKYADTVQLRYALEAEGQAYRQSVFAGEAAPDEDGSYRTVLERDGSTLSITIAPDGTVTRWRHERAWEEDLSLDLWDGFGS